MSCIISNQPLCFEAINRRIENGEKFLYHYTNPKSFFKIIETMALKMSEFPKSDDLNEANLANVDRIDDSRVLNSLERFIKNRCSYLSFIRDGNIDLNEDGTNHPRMWSQYAQKGEGVCIAINKYKFLTINKDKLKGKFRKFSSINYSFDNGANIQLDMHFEKDESEKIIREHYKELFFKKHKDWKEEHEVRLFGIDLPEFLSIYGAIEFICLGAKFIKNENSMNRLIENITNKNSLCYNYLIPHSFADVSHFSYGYFCDGTSAASEICNRLGRDVRHKEYLKKCLVDN